MPRIRVYATFTIAFDKTVTKKQLRELDEGADVDSIIDESEAYHRLSNEGDVEWDWEPITTKRRKRR